MPKKNLEIDKAIKRANIDELVKIVDKLDSAGRAVVLESIGTELTDTKKKKFIEKIKLSAIAADKEVKEWLVGSVSEMYVGGMNTADNKIKKYGIKTGVGKMTVEILKSAKEMSPHLAAVNSLLSDAYLDFGNSMTGYVRGAEHIVNDTMKRQVRQKLAVGRLDGAGIREITKIVKEELGDQGFTVLLDRGGRKWSLKSYSEMLARTHLIKANNEATINRALDFDIDIMEVSSHNTECPICLPYEGKKFSISGNSKEYGKLEAIPPYHPNCKHSLLPRPDLV